MTSELPTPVRYDSLQAAAYEKRKGPHGSTSGFPRMPLHRVVEIIVSFYCPVFVARPVRIIYPLARHPIPPRVRRVVPWFSEVMSFRYTFYGDLVAFL